MCGSNVGACDGNPRVQNADPFEAMVDAEQPVITGVEMGPWASALQAQPVAVPYYTGHISYLPKIRGVL